MPNGTHRFDDGRTYSIPAIAYETHRGGPENIEDSPVVEPFGDYRDLIVLQVIRGEPQRPVEGEPLDEWLRRWKN